MRGGKESLHKHNMFLLASRESAKPPKANYATRLRARHFCQIFQVLPVIAKTSTYDTRLNPCYSFDTLTSRFIHVFLKFLCALRGQLYDSATASRSPSSVGPQATMTRYERPISAIEKEYTDVEEAHSAIQEHQRLEGFVCVKAGNSRNRLTGIVSYRVLQCRQSRCYRESPGKKHKYSTTSYKTNCPFRARILFNKHKNTHSLKVMEPSHNHDPIDSPTSSSTLRLRTQRQFGTERLLSIINKKSKGNELTANQIAEEIHAEHPEILIVGLDVFFLQKKLRLRASRGEPLIQGPVVRFIRALQMMAHGLTDQSLER